MKPRNHWISAALVVGVLFTVDAFWLHVHSAFTSQEFITIFSEIGDGRLKEFAQNSYRPVDLLAAVAMMYLFISSWEGQGNKEPHNLWTFVWQLSYPVAFMLGGAMGTVNAILFGWYGGVYMFGAGLLLGAATGGLFGLAVGLTLRPWRTNP